MCGVLRGRVAGDLLLPGTVAQGTGDAGMKLIPRAELDAIKARATDPFVSPTQANVDLAALLAENDVLRALIVDVERTIGANTAWTVWDDLIARLKDAAQQIHDATQEQE